MNLKKYLKHLLPSLVLVTSLTFSNITEAKTLSKSSVSFPTSFEIIEGNTGSFVSTRLGKTSTKEKKYVQFASKTKNISIKVTSSNPSVLKVTKITKVKYEFEALKEGKATLKLSTSVKKKDGKTFSKTVPVTVKKDTAKIPVSLEVLSKEAIWDAITPIEWKAFNHEGKEITSLLDQTKLSFIVSSSDVSFDESAKTLTFKKANTSAEVKLSYLLEDGSELSATGTIKAIKSPEQLKKEQEELLDYYYSYDNRPVIQSMNFEFVPVSGGGIPYERFTLTMSDEIKDEYKDMYKDPSNYEIKCFSKFNNRYTDLESYKLQNFTINQNIITFNIVALDDRAISSVLPKSDIELTVSTKEGLPYGTASFSKDFRNQKEKVELIFVAGSSHSKIRETTQKQFDLKFSHSFEFTPENSIEVGQVILTPSYDKESSTLTFTFDGDLYNYQGSTVPIQLGTAKILPHETEFEKITDVSLFTLQLVSERELQNDGSHRTRFKCQVVPIQ